MGRSKGSSRPHASYLRRARMSWHLDQHACYSRSLITSRDLMERFRSTSSFAAVVWLGLIGVARAQPDPSGGDIPPPPARADAVTPPVLRTRAEATYPPDALRDRLEGTVGLELEVDERGGVIDARVIAPAGHGFDEAAAAA